MTPICEASAVSLMNSHEEAEGRRQDHPPCLRQDDMADRVEEREVHRRCRVPLISVHAVEAGANDLGQIRRRDQEHRDQRHNEKRQVEA